MSEYKYDKDGHKYVRVNGNLWICEDDLPSREDIKSDDLRFSKPKIYVSGIVLNILMPLSVVSLLSFLCYKFINNDIKQAILVGVVLLAAYIFLRLKDIAIFCVRLYQRFAPEKTRHKCGYYPTCSDYMILAIQKYGLIIGLIKGFRRIKRCDGSHKEEWP